MNTAPRSTASATRGLHLVVSPPEPRSPLVFWHLLSLDAPTVAAVWTAFAAWSAGIKISPLDPLAMFVAVWILYATDRLLDARPLFTNHSAPELEERHRFHHRHRTRFLATLLFAVLPLMFLLHRTAPAVLHLDVLLATLLGAWLLLVHARPAPSTHAHRLPKELAVGVFFPAAVFIPTVARAPALRLALAPEALLLAAICTLNCLFLYAWEHPRSRRNAHFTTRWSLNHLPALAAAVAFASAALTAYCTLPPTLAKPLQLSGLAHTAAIPGACTLTALLLLLLHRSRKNIPPVRLRALADLVLLTPLFVLLLSTLGIPH